MKATKPEGLTTKKKAAAFILAEISNFAKTSSLNDLPGSGNVKIYDKPLVQFADGDDSIFAEFKKIIDPAHLTPREALAKVLQKNPKDLPARLSVISWILPFTQKIRESNRPQRQGPSRFWAIARHYGEKFNDALRGHLVATLTGRGYLAIAPVLAPFFRTEFEKIGPKGYRSNWSERHIAYAAGLGTFSLSDGFITERGIAHRCGSVVTDLPLPVSPRRARTPYANCLFYTGGKCRACVSRCPVGAITEKGHDKIKCREHFIINLNYLLKEYDVGTSGCGLCQTKVPCEFRNPTRKSKTTGT